MQSLNQIKRENELVVKYPDTKVEDTWQEIYLWTMDAVGDDEQDMSGIIIQTLIEQIRLQPNANSIMRNVLAEIDSLATSH